MADHLIIDRAKCIGCGKCVSVCIRDNIRITDKIAEEWNTGRFECFDCGHCMAVCPKDAIRLRIFEGIDDQIHEYDDSEKLLDTVDLMEFFCRRRSCRWFSDTDVTDEEFSKILEFASLSPTAENSRKVEIAVMDRRMNEFMKHIRGILEYKRDQYPRIDQFCDYVDNGMETNNPLIWEGRQMILVFSKEPTDAILAMSRMEMITYAMGLGGFYSRWIRMVEDTDHDKLMEFFPDIPSDMGMNAVFIIGHPRVRYRRTIPRLDRNIHWN